ncbi:protein-disulfide reductase DsbD domain-containing protein [Sediminibacter sp. Hel_I_10]|uniref:protein-disulfide reductase DsbD family protein n=1 Tax=Sediminibacter sp. Hel_I_10 TaxID=1392490 RepID=UPI000A5BEB12|nr:protein-disulfide reductase DsbD domain-containing protein [Sediminibacter sp. Hel_I_10]
MKQIHFTFFTLFFIFSSLNAQVFDPVKWSTSVEKISETEYDLVATATIDEGWHLYSQEVYEDGPVSTRFSFSESDTFKLVGDTSEGKGKTINDPVFEMKIKFFEDRAEFKQRINVLSEALSVVKGEVEFMVCDDEKCLPPNYVDLTFQIKAPEDDSELNFSANSNDSKILKPVTWDTSVEKISSTEFILVSKAKIDKNWHLYSQSVPEDGPIATHFTYETQEGYELVENTSEAIGKTVNDPVFEMKIKYFEDEAEFKQRITLDDSTIKTITAEVEFMACDDKQCLAPSYVDLNFDLTKSVQLSESEILATPEREADTRGLWSIFLVAFLSGFVALLTPCVFPMIPMTVSFFIKQSKSKAKGISNAIIYGLSIIVIYVLLGTIITAIFGADALNALATNVWFNLLFFILLVVFAISFLGAFEIVLPNSWANKADRQADKGGLIGIFFMALALAIISFSCTGPIVGTILVEAASKGGIAPVIGMLGFSSAIALPFALFAAFPGWLNSLPKSGGWLNTVKVVLGFLELAFAFKFLSQADLVLQLHFLEREVFLAIWIAIFGALALYLLGKMQLPHDSPLQHISVGRLLLGLLTLSFTVYMIPGLWGAPLNLISAFPPPLDYAESPYGVGNSKTGGSFMSGSQEELPEGAHILAPYDIVSFNDYEKGMAYAKKVNKPVMIDFTGHACVNCRKMEQNVWVKNRVLQLLKNDVVLISLYVDDKRKLPEGEQLDSKLKPGKKLKYIGQKWSEFQTINYKTNTQPFYALVGHDGEDLIEPVGYTPDVDDYYDWLSNGIDNFK